VLPHHASLHASFGLTSQEAIEYFSISSSSLKMTYSFQLETKFEREPQLDNDGTVFINFVLGYDFEADEIVLMSVLLIPEDGVYELCFGIRKQNSLNTLPDKAPRLQHRHDETVHTES
jgi:hypothetical protein